ncbi:hypothetical protein Taro_000435 [Colocasia esculenta]|uniref:X8 domain-containing protein n=1 Tax=Colocasia esculenta TaxID=4460 RepID=A0A843TF14_COLES|nr:hypothetical protein [Colocasia esculenta]
MLSDIRRRLGPIHTPSPPPITALQFPLQLGAPITQRPTSPTTIPTHSHSRERAWTEQLAMAPAPCLPRSFLFVALLLFVFSISSASGGLLGVDYGRDADNLIPPEKVVELLKANGIGAASIYDGDAQVIQAFRGSGIKLVVSLRNELLAQAARDPNFAGTWVWEHVGQYFPATQIEAVSVGNEVTHQRPDLTQFLLPAMQNVFNAINNLGHADKIKVSTPFAFSAVSVSFPPSKGSFRGDLQPLVRQILQFLDRTGSYFMINIFPFFTYRDVPNISREYFLGLPNPGVRDPDSGRVYQWLLHAQIDATLSAMAALGFGNTAAVSNATVGGAYSQSGVKRKVAIKETGCPHCGRGWGRWNRAILEETDAGGSILNASLAQEKGCSLQNAQTYNSNLVRTILSGKTGTPLYPDADMDVYIFSLFNENLKQGPESERSFGLFYPDGTKVYDVPFPSPGAGSWCVANPAVGWERMQAALDWACGQGGADCGPIQPGASCFEPNTVEAHASYAMNSYYQRHGRDSGACDFSGAGRIVYERPTRSYSSLSPGARHLRACPLRGCYRYLDPRSPRACLREFSGRWASSILQTLPWVLPSAVVYTAAARGIVGVDYGRMMDNPMPPKDVDNGFRTATIYDADAGVIRTFRNSGIKLGVSLPNNQLENSARNPNYADTWVREHFLFPAMQNVYNALKNLNLADNIKVSTPFAMSALNETFPLSKGRFRDDLLPTIRQILKFLDGTGSFSMVNIYPFIAYRDEYPKISREYFLGLPYENYVGESNEDTGLMYDNLLDAERDAVFSAMAALGFASQRQQGSRQNLVPTDETSGAGRTLNSSLAAEPGCSIEDAQAYNSILVQRIRSENTGTPLHPNADMINLKPGTKLETSFGLFYPNDRKGVWLAR